MIQPVPPLPGMGDIGVFLQIVSDSKALKAHYDKLAKAHAEADEAIRLAGGAEKLRKGLEEIDALKTEAQEAKTAADKAREDAKARVAAAEKTADDIRGKARAEAEQIVEEALADAKSRNAKCVAREKDAARREEEATETERRQEARAADLDRREAQLNALEARLTRWQAQLQAVSAPPA